MKRLFKKPIGASLIEMVVALGIFGLIISSVSLFTLESLRANKNANLKTEANLRIQEIYHVLNQKKSESWKSITSMTNLGPYHLQFLNNKYQFVPGAAVVNGVTTQVVVGNVYRDGSNNLSTNPADRLDPSTRKLTIQVSWVDLLGQTKSMVSTLLVTDWNVIKWNQSSASEFDLGTKNYVVTADTAGGELKMENIAYPDWCKPRFSTTALDLPGSGLANAITSIEGRSFIGTGSATPSATNPSFINVGVTNTKPPLASTQGVFSGIKVNAVFGEGNYAFLATDNDNEEVQILDLTTASPYTRVGWFNAPGTANADSVYTVGTKGYVTTTDSKLYVFDLAAKTGSRTQLGVKTLMGEGSEVQVVGNYAYISLTNGSHIELQTVDISNPANMFTVGVGNTSQSDASDLFVNAAGTRAYVGTAASATEKEFLIFDTATKTGPQTVEYFQESGGQVSIEAEHYHTNLTRGGKSWSTQTGGTPSGASNNAFMTAGPDTGTTINTDYFNTSPELGYRVNFATTGTYYFWVRAYPTNTGNNNVHGGYDGANFPSVEGLNTTSYNAWRWFKGSIDIRTAEVHWINIWMQDDGFKLDKIVLSTSSSFTPSTTGPAESTRTTASITVPEINRQVGQYETTGMSIEGITVVENNTRAILVGTGGEEYQVLNIENEAAPVRCGGLQLDAGIKGISSVKEADQDSYSYIITQEPNAEFKIIKGGAGYDPSQGGNYDEEYNATGDFISDIFDSTSTFTNYTSLTWDATSPPNTSVKIQLRTGGTPAEVASNPWFGPDGTATTFFSDPLNSTIPATAFNKRYIQYRVYFTSDGLKTPTFSSISISYEI